MESEVTILGLWRCDPYLEGMDTLDKFRGNVWTILDWYRSYPFILNPHRVYELHGRNYVRYCMANGMVNGYYPGEWKEKYRSVQELHVWDEKWREELGSDNIRIVDFEKLKAKYGEKTLSSTGSTMVCEAVEAGYKKIHITGFSMKTAYLIEATGMLKAIACAEREGVEIVTPYRDRWERDASGFTIGRRVPDSYIGDNMILEEMVNNGALKSEIIAFTQHILEIPYKDG